MKKKSIRILSWLLTLIVFFMSINLSFISKAEGNGPSVYINPSNTQAIYTYDIMMIMTKNNYMFILDS